MSKACLVEEIMRYVGQTVTIFTESGGLSGSGFTGILAFATPDCVKLITSIGAPPACPIGSACVGLPFNNCAGGFCGGYGGYYGASYRNMPVNFLGSVVEIPVCKIVSFTHNAL